MDMLLIIVTLLSIAMAIVMACVSWRLVREERRRSEARIAALARQSATPEATHSTAAMGQEENRPGGGSAPSWDELPLGARGAVARSAGGSAGTDHAGPAIPRADDHRVTEDLFVQKSSPDWLRRLVVVSAVGIVMGVGLGMVLVLPGSRADGSERQGEALTAVPLELVTLRHARDGTALSITGVVRNPRHGREARRVSAVAALFDQSGALIATERAPLDYTVLLAGSDSPFVITVPAGTRIGRYRLSFRDEDGQIIPHIDRRPAVDGR